jgi:hypothetical protein
MINDDSLPGVNQALPVKKLHPETSGLGHPASPLNQNPTKKTNPFVPPKHIIIRNSS